MPTLEEQVRRRIADALNQAALDIMSGSPKPEPTFTPIYGLRGY